MFWFHICCCDEIQWLKQLRMESVSLGTKLQVMFITVMMLPEQELEMTGQIPSTFKSRETRWLQFYPGWLDPELCCTMCFSPDHKDSVSTEATCFFLLSPYILWWPLSQQCWGDLKSFGNTNSSQYCFSNPSSNLLSNSYLKKIKNIL